MRKFILNIFIFILPLISLGFIMEVLIREIPNDYTKKKSYLDKNAHKIKTLALGHSQILAGFNPEFMTINSYNASFAAQSIKYDYKILEKYSDDFTSLDYVVIPASYLSLFYKLETSDLKHLIKNYNIYFNIDTNPNSLYRNEYEVFSLNFKTNINRLRSYYYHKKNAIAFGKYGWKERGEPNDLIVTGEADAKRHIEYFKLAIKEKYEKENLKYLKLIFDLCKKKNIHVILITPPTYYSYRNKIDNDYLDLTYNSINKILSEYNNASYLNLFDNLDFEASDYRDANHLNVKGAEKMTKMINNHILNLKSN